jgi:hypothetical protein
MVLNIEQNTPLTREKLLVYFGDEALFRRKPDLTSYGTLLKLVSQITRSVPDQEMKGRLHKIAKLNKLLLLA